MKHSRQLIVESVVIAALLLGILFAGSLSSGNLPQSWLRIQNPDAVQPKYNLTAVAVYYNDTLTSLSGYRYQSVSSSLSVFRFLAVPSSVNETAKSANGEIASINQSLPEAQYYLNETQYFYEAGSVPNASAALSSFCAAIKNANASLDQFAGPTTTSFSGEGVPVQIYEPPTLVLQNEIAAYYNQCLFYKSRLGNGTTTNLVISSDQTLLAPYGKLWVYTGGELNLTSTLRQNNLGVGGQTVTFHIDGRGSNPANLTTTSGGSVTGTVTIPFFYDSSVDVWATVDANSTAGIPALVISNTLNLTLIYNETQIIIGDPPQVLPTFPFTVSGVLKDNGTGAALPDAPVRITSFNSSYYTNTNASGVFTYVLKVPANATSGLHYVDAAFAPRGEYGPSFNFTSIIVYRLPLNLTLDPPPLVFPGFPASISGSVSANGSALANSRILLSTPWGIYNATTDPAGEFSAVVHVPISEFSFSKQITVSAVPIEPYIAGASVNAKLGMLNLLVVAVVASVAGFGYYQARNLEIRLPRPGRKGDGNSQQEEAVAIKDDGLSRADVTHSPFVRAYVAALSLAAKKFGIQFPASFTIRETVNLVAGVDQGGRGSVLFSKIAQGAEDYLYSKAFLGMKSNHEELKSAEESLRELETIWSA